MLENKDNNEPRYTMSKKAVEEKTKTMCRTSVQDAVREIVSWNGLSRQTRDKVVEAFGELFHKFPEKELDVYWCFDMEKD